MNRLLELAPYLATTALMTAGSVSGFRPGVMLLTSLACALYLAPVLALKHRRGRLSPIDLGLAVYVASHLVGWGAWSGLALALAAWPSASLYLVFLLVATLPQLLGQEPFTTHFARRVTPPAAWQGDLFRRINLTMSWVWAGLFALALGASLAPTLLGWRDPLTQSLFRNLVSLVLMLGVGLPFTKLYPAHAQRRAGLDPSRLAELANAPAPVPPEPPTNPTRPKEKTMNARPTVVAVNGSPHAGMGNTAQMIEMLRPELEAQGLDLEVILLAGKDIAYCQGCGFCMQRGQCWIQDDHAGITERLLAADAVILGSPCYFFHVTAQMKTFLDRCLALGHKPRPTWKPGLAISVAASVGELDTARYLGGVLRSFGAFSVGSLTALATAPGGFLGREAVEARARDLARDLAVAVKEKRRYPATGADLVFFQFMGELVSANKERIMKDDYEHWRKCGLIDGGFTAYVQQEWAEPPHDERMRQAWIKQMIAQRKAGRDPAHARQAMAPAATPSKGPQDATSCRQLLEMMPRSFNAAAAGDLQAVYQFEVSGAEDFTAHLTIANGRCEFGEGPAKRPDVTIQTPAEVWLDISRGRLDGQAAFMAGKFRARGDLGLLMRLGGLFG